VVAALFAAAVPGASRATILLAAPVAWAPVVNALIDDWQAAGGGAIKVDYGDSDDQAIEIEMNARPYDLIIAADPHAIFRVLSKQLIGNPEPLASSPLVLVVTDHDPPIGSAADLAGLPGSERVAVADPQSDGVGVATRDVLSQEGRWEMLQSRLLIVAGSRAVVQAVHHGEACCGIALRADLTAGDQLHEIGSPLVDAAAPQVTYMAAPVAARRRDEVLRFIGFLHSSQAARTMLSRGFAPERGE
jgi:molybdenum ABC transporter molybdate-binding protein